VGQGEGEVAEDLDVLVLQRREALERDADALIVLDQVTGSTRSNRCAPWKAGPAASARARCR